jgi:hypothetical protein
MGRVARRYLTRCLRRLVGGAWGRSLIVVVLVSAAAGCTPAGRHASSTKDVVNLTLAGYVPIVHCPGRRQAALPNWGATQEWTRVGPSVVQGTKGIRGTIVIFRDKETGSFGQAVLCSRRGAVGRKLTFKAQMRALTPTDVWFSLKSLSTYRRIRTLHSKTIPIRVRWRPVTFSGRLDPTGKWYAVYLTTSDPGPVFLRRVALRLDKG